MYRKSNNAQGVFRVKLAFVVRVFVSTSFYCTYKCIYYVNIPLDNVCMYIYVLYTFSIMLYMYIILMMYIDTYVFTCVCLRTYVIFVCISHILMYIRMYVLHIQYVYNLPYTYTHVLIHIHQCISIHDVVVHTHSLVQLLTSSIAST